jgi:four helix bundle protein
MLLCPMPINSEYVIIKKQLVKSATSSGANYEESQAASSKADFHHKVKIALREKRESNYWLRVLNAILDTDYNQKELAWLIDESLQLKKILGTIAHKTKKQ